MKKKKDNNPIFIDNDNKDEEDEIIEEVNPLPISPEDEITEEILPPF